MNETLTKHTSSQDLPVYTAKDFDTNQDIRWCPGCGDYAILKQVKTVLPTLGIDRENIVFISGIGCSSRFPYYVNTYGMHSIHGRAVAVATGLKLTRPELSVWIVTGDGDCLSIGGNHFIHLLRRNVNVNVLLFNNKIYGLTKGQYSPTSEIHKVTKSSPDGSLDEPFNVPLLALGAKATFVARSLDTESSHLRETLQRSAAYQGTSFLEIFQNCNIFNDGAFHVHKDKQSKHEHTLFVEKGKPLIFGAEKQLGIKIEGMTAKIVSMEEFSLEDLWIHDEKDLQKAHLLAQFDELYDEQMKRSFPTPLGVLYANSRPTYTFHQQLDDKGNRRTVSKNELQDILKGSSAWEVH